MAERMKRGLKAEMEEAREILDAYVEENRALVGLLAKGRGYVQQLQQASASFTPDDGNDNENNMATVSPCTCLLSLASHAETHFLLIPWPSWPVETSILLYLPLQSELDMGANGSRSGTLCRRYRRYTAP